MGACSSAFISPQDRDLLAKNIHDMIVAVDPKDRNAVMNLLIFCWNIYEILTKDDQNTLDQMARDHRLQIPSTPR